MSYRIVALGTVALSSAIAVSSTVPASLIGRVHVPVLPGTAALRAYGGRSVSQQLNPADSKLDAALADLAEHVDRVQASHALADLHSLSPAARFKFAADGTTPLVSVDAVTRGDAQVLKAALERLGLERAAVYANDVGGWLPVAQLRMAAARAEVHSLRAAMSRTRTGAVTSQGDFVQHSAAIRSSKSLTGTGVTVGVLSDSYDCYSTYAASGSGVPAAGYAGYAYNGFTATAATDTGTGDLPSSVNVIKDAMCANYGAPVFTPFGDEGRAMLQIVHDVAPGAALAFYTAEDSEADFAAGIAVLAAAGASVIADDVGYFDEPFYQDGLVAQAVDAAAAGGAAYFSAAGNDADASYENSSPTFATAATGATNSGEYLLNFDTSGNTTTTSLPVTIDAMIPGQFTAIVVEWDQPFVTGAPDSGGATSRIDLCVTGTTSVYTIENNDGTAVTCTGANAAGIDPVQILIIANPASATASTPKETLNVVIGLANPASPPGRVKVVVETDGQTDPALTTFATHSATIQGHAGAAGAVTMAAAFYDMTPACGTTPASVEPFSSEGGSLILFDTSGNRLATPVVRQKPDVTGPDGGNDTFLGFTLAAAGVTGANGELPTTIAGCQNVPSYPNFFGTSAATPHAAGIAALILQANAAVTPSQLYAALRNSALPMGGASGYDTTSGFGLVQADAALALIPAGAPSLSVSPASLVVGASAMLTWASFNSTGCTASGGWSGAQGTSGTLTVTPTAAGSVAYSLTCSNAVGVSSATTADLAVTATAPTGAVVSTGGGGGGSVDPFTVLALGILGAARVVRARRRPTQLSSNEAGVIAA